MTHICINKLTITGPDNGLSPGWRQAIIWTNAGILLIRTLGTNFSKILIKINTFSLKKMHLKMSSGRWLPSCLGLNVLKAIQGIKVRFAFDCTPLNSVILACLACGCRYIFRYLIIPIKARDLISLSIYWDIVHMLISNKYTKKADSRLAPSQWETPLQGNAVSHWLIENLESALSNPFQVSQLNTMPADDLGRDQLHNHWYLGKDK